MATTKSKTIRAELKAMDVHVVKALQLLHAVGLLESSDDGWSYTAPAFVALPGSGKLVHWSTGTAY